jgi:hypothetical protein
MLFKVIVSRGRLIIFLIAFQCITPAFASQNEAYILHSTMHNQPNQNSFFSLIFEKAEEERNEEERDRFMMVEIADFSKLSILLSLVHTPHILIQSYEHRYDRPSMIMLFCAYLI